MTRFGSRRCRRRPSSYIINIQLVGSSRGVLFVRNGLALRGNKLVKYDVIINMCNMYVIPFPPFLLLLLLLLQK